MYDMAEAVQRWQKIHHYIQSIVYPKGLDENGFLPDMGEDLNYSCKYRSSQTQMLKPKTSCSKTVILLLRQTD